MGPVAIAAVTALARRRRLPGIAIQPLGNIVVEELLAPDHAGESLALHVPSVRIGDFGLEAGIELVGFAAALLEDLVEAAEVRGRRVAELQAEARRAVGGHGDDMVSGRLRAGLRGVDGIAAALHDVVVEGVLVVRLDAVDAVQSGDVGFVVAEEEARVALRVEEEGAEVGMLRRDDAGTGRMQSRSRRVRLPRPRVPKPQLRQHVQRRLVRAAVAHLDFDQHMIRRCLGIFHEDVEVAILVEDAGVEQLELGSIPAAAAVLVQQPAGETRLRILVKHLEVMRRRGIEVVVELLDVFAMIAFGVGEPKSVPP